MTTKKMDTTQLENELKEMSVFFRKPAATPLPAPQPQNTQINPASNQESYEAISERTNERPNERTSEVTKHAPMRRSKMRHSFDIYRDQYLALKELELEAVRNGRKKKRLGDMVQKALDMYIEIEAKRHKKRG